MTSASIAGLFREKVFVSLIAFADETGTHDRTGVHEGAEVAGVVGYLSWKEDWDIFTGLWNEVLKHYEVPVFHMSEFSDEINGPKNPKWPYRGWSREKKDQFIRELVANTRDNALIGVGGLVGVRDYDAIVPDWLKTQIGHPYYFCFQLFFDTILDALTKFEHPFPPGEQVAFFFDQQQEFKNKALEVFDNLHAIKDVDNRMGAITFVRKEQYIPLQAADLLAFRMRKVVTRKLKGLQAINSGSWDEELGARRNLIVGHYDADNLKIAVEGITRVTLELMKARQQFGS
jgi:hypothetical protein